jgi:hypothetical protein
VQGSFPSVDARARRRGRGSAMLDGKGVNTTKLSIDSLARDILPLSIFSVLHMMI